MNASAIRNVVVVGNGPMGIGIAQTFAQAGIGVSLVGRSESSLKKASQKIRDNLDLFVEMKILAEQDCGRTLQLIRTTVDLESACRGAQYVTEVIPEVMEAKQELFRQIDSWCQEEVILASCTSTLSIEQIGSVTSRPDRVIGTHWVKPAHIIQLVEVVLGPKTSTETASTTRTLLERIGKVTAVCKENPGHIQNAMQYALSKVAFDLLERGIASAEDIDTVAKHGFGFRMACLGPIERLNLGSLEGFKNNWESIDLQNGSLGPFPAFLQEMIDQGRTGLKEYSQEEARFQTKERDRQLIKSLKALARIR
ncbi:MAG: 3-hydroxyacyl-CoA dehydrogenase family protein [Burkholderiales bacterium]|nr:3-hydroxyacyl-CoA dehydrogenase family protein [Burkholderiales bacterium]